jgi:hypothetical protein
LQNLPKKSNKNVDTTYENKSDPEVDPVIWERMGPRALHIKNSRSISMFSLKNSTVYFKDFLLVKRRHTHPGSTPLISGYCACGG